MKIYPHMLDYNQIMLSNPTLGRILFATLVAKYMEYPPKNRAVPFVIQRHEIGDSQHFDFRIKSNGYLTGWSIVGFSKDKPATLDVFFNNIGKGFRAETKARQPSDWLKVEGKVEPGEVGAAVEKAGKFTILATGKAIHGVHKPYFHEYFVKGGRFRDWTRFVVRAVRVRRLGPGKRPTKKYEIMWRWMLPKDQLPYALSTRAIRKGYKPPKGIIPFPVEWAKKKFPKEYARWEEYMKKKKSLGRARMTIVEHTWMGAGTRRGVPQREWHLLIDDGETKIMDFRTESSPIFESPIAFSYEGRISKKWLDYEGKLKPLEHWNPNRELESNLKIWYKGVISLNKEKKNGISVYTIKSNKAPLKGTFTLRQEEKGSVFYTWRREKILSKAYFVYDRHTIEDTSHYDLRIKLPELDYIIEYSGMRKDLSKLKIEEPVYAFRKKCYDLEWVNPRFKKGMRKVAGRWTKVERLDIGSIQIIENNVDFMSMKLRGKKLNGYYTARRTDGIWIVMESKLPKGLSSGDPRTGEYFSPFKIIQKRGWNYFRVLIYDPRAFTRLEPFEYTRLYFPDLKIPSDIDIRIGLFSRVGRIHGARVVAVDFPLDWSEKKAVSWIKKNGLHTWISDQIRRRK